ncbi:unnamed protein product [Auanema sp. JU1783]|nr:unnamed protein product [Auanema sp. JU1783]
MESYRKFALLNKINVACDLPVGTFEERFDVLDEMERHYAPHVYDSHSLIRKLIVPVMISEFSKPKLDPWAEAETLKFHRKIMGITAGTVSAIIVAGVFWFIRK